jgi:three-Cys-motif partner protein
VAKKLGTIWPLEPHTAAKHAILKRYLQAWLPIMARYNDRIIYLDGFAGPGEYAGGEPGSPIIALTAAIDQPAIVQREVVFLFVEEKQERLTNLRGSIANLTIPERFKVDARLGNCAAVLGEILDRLDHAGSTLAPTFAFLDPFGFSDTPMTLVKRLMQHGRCEVLITFMFEEINRFLEHEQQPTHFDSLFGTTEWRSALAQATPAARRSFLKHLYQQQLRSAAGIRHVLAFEMRNQADNLDYILFFGTNSVDGLKKMKESMWKVDPVAGFTFSDATDPGQVVMFTGEPDKVDIQRRLVDQFSGRVVPVEAVEAFILEATPYRETHYKAVLKAMESADPSMLTVISAKMGRKRGTFPADTVVRFA